MFHATFGTSFQSKHVLQTTMQSPDSGMRKRKPDAGYGNVDSNHCCCDITLSEVEEYQVVARLISCEHVTLMDRGRTILARRGRSVARDYVGSWRDCPSLVSENAFYAIPVTDCGLGAMPC